MKKLFSKKTLSNTELFVTLMFKDFMENNESLEWLLL